jgi:hypothetical protein
MKIWGGGGKCAVLKPQMCSYQANENITLTYVCCFPCVCSRNAVIEHAPPRSSWFFSLPGVDTLRVTSQTYKNFLGEDPQTTLSSLHLHAGVVEQGWKWGERSPPKEWLEWETTQNLIYFAISNANFLYIEYSWFPITLFETVPRDEKIDSHQICNSCKFDANLVVWIRNHCEFIFATR